jgi:hypothetical protein
MITDYNSSSNLRFTAMKSHRLSIFASVSLAVLLTACGGDNVQIALPGASVTAEAGAPNAGPAAQADAPAGTYQASQITSANMPQPDCIADGCKGLRIIDANAEAFRYQAMHGDAPQS